MSAIGNTVVPVRDQRTEVASTSWECSKAQDQVFHIYICKCISGDTHDSSFA